MDDAEGRRPLAPAALAHKRRPMAPMNPMAPMDPFLAALAVFGTGPKPHNRAALRGYESHCRHERELLPKT